VLFVAFDDKPRQRAEVIGFGPESGKRGEGFLDRLAREGARTVQSHQLWISRLVFAGIAANAFADGGFDPNHVEDIVGDLKREPDGFAE